MKILFCRKGATEANNRFAALLPEHQFIFCAPDEIEQHVHDVDVVAPLVARVDARLIERGSFKLVQQFGVGLDTVDIEAATRAGIWVARIPSGSTGNAASVAEHALLLTLSLSRRLQAAHEAFNAGRLGQPMGAALSGKTACIVGMGNIGTAVAKRLHVCGMRLTAVHEHPERGAPPETGVERLFTLPELRDAVADADYVLLCINYDTSRYHLIGQAELAAMKPGAFLINVARGGLLDHDALLHALKSAHLAGAGLDVFWEEPVDPSHPLFAENVVATPHIAGVTDVSLDGTGKAFAENIRRYARGETPYYAVNVP